jgi:predicted RNA binding protein YcfA (HicA-like mRNA interferase family)
VPIDSTKLRSVTAREMIKALAADGFTLKTQRGSHQRYQHADGRRVTLPYHGSGTTFVPKTLRSMVEEQAGWDEADLRRLGLLR